MSKQNTRRMSQLQRSRRIFVFILVGVLVAGTPTLVAGFSDIIFDPANFSKNVQQIANLLQQLDRTAEQIRRQQLMLAHLRVSVADALALAGESLHVRLSASPAGPIESQYPISFPPALPAWLETKRIEWNASQRGQVLHERDLMQYVHDQMLPTAVRVSAIIEASNGVRSERGNPPGQVAVAQAHEELLTSYSGEVDKLLAIRALRAERRDNIRARQQSEAAYQQARRHDLMIDWKPAMPLRPKAVQSPFSGRTVE